MKNMKNVVLRDIADLVGLSALMAFTLVVTATAIAAKGALLYFYEPNRLIWILEVFLGIYGVTIGLLKIKETIGRGTPG